MPASPFYVGKVNCEDKVVSVCTIKTCAFSRSATEGAVKLGQLGVEDKQCDRSAAVIVGTVYCVHTSKYINSCHDVNSVPCIYE